MCRNLLACALLLAITAWPGCGSLHAQSSTNPSANQTDEHGFVPLFDGKTLDGWHKTGGDGEYHIEDGMIIGICENNSKNTFLRTNETYSDFEFRCDFKWNQLGNSGIQYRSHQLEDEQGSETGRVYGYQFELDPSERSWSGGLFEEGRRKWLYDLEGEENTEKRDAIKLDDWNQIVIRCEGNRIRTWLNGVEIVDYVDEANEALAEGFFALQVHSGKTGEMCWRNLRIKELDIQ